LCNLLATVIGFNGVASPLKSDLVPTESQKFRVSTVEVLVVLTRLSPMRLVCTELSSHFGQQELHLNCS